MLELWRKTFALLRRRPILWAPYLFAELLITFLWRLRGMAAIEIFGWSTTRRSVSVFGGVTQTQSLDYNDRGRAAMAYIPLGFSTQLACVCVFIFALVMTSKLVGLILAERKPDLMAALKTTALRWRQILWFSLRSLLVCLVLVAVFVIPTVYFVTENAVRPELLESPILVSVEMLVLAACAAWLLIPTTIRLLQTSKSEIVNGETSRQGMIFAIVAVASTLVLGFIAPKLEAGVLLASQARLTTVSVVTELLVNSPLAPLFIALSVLSFENSDEAQSQQNGPA